MDTIYMVETCMHNEKTGAWNYKQTKFFDGSGDPELAKQQAQKMFHSQMNTYTLYGDLDHAACIVWDCWGNIIDQEYWHKLDKKEN